MTNLGSYALGDTVYIFFATNAADGGRENFSATLEEADFVITKDGAAMTLDASTITITDPFNSDTGIQKIAVDLSNDADFTYGSKYCVYVHPDETIDSQSVAGVLGYFSIDVPTKVQGTFSGTHSSTTSDLGTNAPSNDITGMTLYNPTDEESREVDSYNTGTGVATHAAWDTGSGVTNGEPWVLIPTAPVGATTLAAINAEVDTAISDYDPPTKAELDVLGTTALATSSALITAQNDLDTITGSDGATLATAQGNYAPAVAGAEMDIVDAPNATAITAIQSGLATAASVAAIRGIPTKNATFTFQFTMHDATDGWTLEPSITVTAEVSKEGANFGAASGTVTEVEEGIYEFAAAAGDMNTNYGSFKFTGTGCRPTVVNFVTDGGV